MRLKIVSDGTANGTQVVNAETGEAVEFVKNVIWQISSDEEIARVWIELVKVPIDVVGEKSDEPPPIEVEVEQPEES